MSLYVLPKWLTDTFYFSGCNVNAIAVAQLLIEYKCANKRNNCVVVLYIVFGYRFCRNSVRFEVNLFR